MSADLLREVGEALYGPRWQADLARNLNVARRNVVRWAAGEFQVPPGIWTDSAALLAERRRALADLAKKLPR